MGLLSDEIENIGIETLISTFISSLSKDNREFAKDNAKGAISFIEKFDEGTMLLLFKDGNGDAQLVIAKKKDIDSRNEISPINLSTLIKSAVSQL